MYYIELFQEESHSLRSCSKPGRSQCPACTSPLQNRAALCSTDAWYGLSPQPEAAVQQASGGTACLVSMKLPEKPGKWNAGVTRDFLPITSADSGYQPPSSPPVQHRVLLALCFAQHLQFRVEINHLALDSVLVLPWDFLENLRQADSACVFCNPEEEQPHVSRGSGRAPLLRRTPPHLSPWVLAPGQLGAPRE